MRTHGLVGTPEYRAWHGMKERCLNPASKDFPRYGGRGIEISAAWIDDAGAFVAHVGPRPTPLHSIDRIDVNGDYEPGNVRWATRKEQQQNRRCNVMVTLRGETKCLSQWCRDLGVSFEMVHGRIRRGWPPERSLLDPPVEPGHGRNGLRTYPELAARGEANGNARMTLERVIELRAARAAGASLTTIARQFGISVSTAHSITSGRTWKAA